MKDVEEECVSRLVGLCRPFCEVGRTACGGLGSVKINQRISRPVLTLEREWCVKVCLNGVASQPRAAQQERKML